uniref:Uncharacterized protein n=1 Tax=Trichogramma kaykai TaxID=54128 RepID=A0ABD2XB76_9HYME
MGPRTDTILLRLLNDRTLFSDDDMNYFFKRALDDKNMKIIRLLYLNGFDIHDANLDNGKSAVHYLAKVDEPGDRYKVNNEVTLKMMKFFLSNAYKIHCDVLGYTYLHAACMVGDVTTVRWFAIRGVNANLKVYKHSPLHIAAQYRNEDIVKALLKSGANPNLRDHERSTALHALTWVRLCRCVRRDNFCSRRKPVDGIVEALVERGADIEARNNHGDTPLQLAVSRFDVELTRSLLGRGASTQNLNEDRMFSGEFEPYELKNYPVTLNIIEVVQLLKSAGYDMSLRVRLRMLKLWMKVRGKDADHWLADYSGKYTPFGFPRVIICNCY